MMSKLPTTNTIKTHLTCPQLPLAVYREVAAHLRQVTGVKTGLIIRSSDAGAEKFDYAQSQIAALWLEYPQNITPQQKKRIDEILDYYGQRYHPWETATS
ncbi:MAG: hypothetical protein AAGA80_23730 [Cyanobacteria bacterium P01_F01_bin.143]